MMAHAVAGHLRVIDAALVDALLDEDRLQSLMASAFRAVSAGTALQGLRQILPLAAGEGRCLSLMPGTLPDGRGVGAKVTAVMPGNHRLGLQSHQGLVILFDARTGAPLALLHGGEITGRRTSAATAVATRLLARPDAHVLTILGTGEQAARHLRSLACVRRWSEIRLWGRRSEAAAQLATAAADWVSAPLRPMHSVAAAVAGADVVTMVTGASDPILTGDMLEPGMHINLIGSSTPDCREADADVIAAARCFGDSRAMLAHAGGEWRHALATGRIAPEHLIGEIGDLLDDRVEGRRDDSELTLFKSLGMPAQDLFVAEALLQLANQRNVGQMVCL